MNDIFVMTGKVFWYLARHPWFLATLGLILLANGGNEIFERWARGAHLFKGNAVLMIWNGFWLIRLAYAESDLIERR